VPANQELGEQEKGWLLLTLQIEGVVQPKQPSEAGKTSTMKKTRAREDKEDKDAGGSMRDKDDA